MGATVAVLSKKGGNAAETAVAMLEASTSGNAEGYGIASPTKAEKAESCDALRLLGLDSSIIIGHVFSKTLARDRPQPLKLKNGTLVFDGRIYPANAGTWDGEVAARKLWLGRAEDVKAFIRKTEGDYAFVIAETERLVAGRDSMGMRPLYYGENKSFAALASERKALWKIGVEDSDSFPPGQVSFIDKHGFEFAPARTILHVRQRHIDMQAASEKLLTFLQRSVEERLSDLKQCAVAFSGGLDSSIIAFLAKNFGVDVHLIHVSLENQVETEHAEKVANELRLPIHSYAYAEQDVHTTVAKVLQLIEKSDPVQTSIGIPIYWTAERARQMGFEVMLAGQGADELFAGYRRYVDDYIRFGSKKAQKTVLKDVAELYKNNLERDAKICDFHNIELRLPFATFRIAKFASELPLDLKIEPKAKTARKLVLRQLAKNLGLQKKVVDRPKKALQYTTGVNKALKNIARKKGLSVNEYVKDAFQRTFKQIVSHG